MVVNRIGGGEILCAFWGISSICFGLKSHNISSSSDISKA